MRKKDYKDSFYPKIWILIAITLFMVVNIIKKEPFSTQIQLVSIYFAGEAGNEFYKYKSEKEISNLILGIISIIMIIAGIILYF